MPETQYNAMSEPLKYLFKALFKDGKGYEQNPDDVSVNDPTTSCYADIKDKEIELFMLSEGGKFDTNTYLVNLIDGHFEINDIVFFMHDERYLTDYKLIYFRRVRESIQMNAGTGELDRSTRKREVTFRFGWEAKDKDGNVFKRIMEIE